MTNKPENFSTMSAPVSDAATTYVTNPSDMDIMRWHDSYLVGYPPINDVHKEFSELVGRLQQAPDVELPALLGSFVSHAVSHFDKENRWMRETDFPARERHINEHTAVMTSVFEVCELLTKGNHAVVRSLAVELADWFPGHIDYLDSALSHWMCKHRLGAETYRAKPWRTCPVMCQVSGVSSSNTCFRLPRGTCRSLRIYLPLGCTTLAG